MKRTKRTDALVEKELRRRQPGVIEMEARKQMREFINKSIKVVRMSERAK